MDSLKVDSFTVDSFCASIYDPLTMNKVSHSLYYIHDPMCSWCWAFRDVWQKIQPQLPESVQVHYLLGGLAADSDLPMPLSMQQTIQQHWQVITQQVRGVEFNFDFWTECEPRRSTYPACRAVIAARRQGDGYEVPMIIAIQQAYYRNARNPSDDAVLMDLAAQLGLHVDQFQMDLQAAATQKQLMREINQAQDLGCSGFPSLILNKSGLNHNIVLDYNETESMLKQIQVLTELD